MTAEQKELETLLLNHLKNDMPCEYSDFSQTAFALIELWKMQGEK